MRYVIYGAGAIGGVVGARLHQAGHEVALIARGAHLEAIQRDGLRLGRLHGVPTPLNQAICRLADGAVREGVRPGQLAIDELFDAVAS